MALNRRSLLKGLTATAVASLTILYRSTADTPEVATRYSRSSRGWSAAIPKFPVAGVAEAWQELHRFNVPPPWARCGGRMVENRCRPDATSTLYSSSRGFNLTAVVFAVMEGKRQVTYRVVDFFSPQRSATVTETRSDLTIEHLLTMFVGRGSDFSDGMQRERRLGQGIPVDTDREITRRCGSWLRVQVINSRVCAGYGRKSLRLPTM